MLRSCLSRIMNAYHHVIGTGGAHRRTRSHPRRDDVMRTRARVTAIPALLSAAVLAQLPGALRAVAHEGHATPEAAGSNPWADLGLPELTLAFTSSEVSGMPESVAAGRYLVTITGEPSAEDFAFSPLFLRLPDGMTLEQAMEEAGANPDAPPAFYYDAVL